MLILEDLYLGDVRPSERSFKRNSQYRYLFAIDLKECKEDYIK